MECGCDSTWLLSHASPWAAILPRTGKNITCARSQAVARRFILLQALEETWTCIVAVTIPVTMPVGIVYQPRHTISTLAEVRNGEFIVACRSAHSGTQCRRDRLDEWRFCGRNHKWLRHSIRQLNPDVRICFVTMLPILNNKYVSISS